MSPVAAGDSKHARSPSDTKGRQFRGPDFDIVQKYNSLLAEDSSLTPPIAAIETLLALLTSSPATTVSETLDLLQASSATLRDNIPNSLALSAGTDLFQRYLVTTLQRPGALGPGGDFGVLRQNFLSNSRLFVQRAKEARSKIAIHASPFITSDATIVTYGPSRVVTTLLQKAAESGKYFSVIAITPSTPSLETQMKDQVSALRGKQIPTSLIAAHATAYALSTLAKSRPSLVICGASTVLENGGVTSTLGGYQLALLAKALQIPFYVATESYKFVRLYPLSQLDLPLPQNIVKFEGGEENPGVTGKGSNEKECLPDEDMVDYTPPELITALISENGVMTPNAVSEELIKLWF